METKQERVFNRWAIAAAGVVMQLSLGAVYAWSVFQIPLRDAFGWSKLQVTVTFTITIFMLGVTAFFGGLWMAKRGPRRVAMVAGLFYGVGVMLASLSANRLEVLYITYGVIAGIGTGLGYIVPVATLLKWFPDKRGLATGMAVTGFGGGALLTAPIATVLIQSTSVLTTFLILGFVYLIAVVGAGSIMRNPPDGWKPAGWQPTKAQVAQRAPKDYELKEAVKSWQWYALWTLLFLNVTAGIALISQAAAMAEEITKVSSLVAAGLVGIFAIANGVGRLAWAWLSDIIGRKWVFLVMYLLQAALFFSLPLTNSFAVFAALGFVIILCYGGGFGTMPAFTADYFGSKRVGAIYGLMLTAWGFASVLGPVLIAYIYENTGTYTLALYIIGGILLAGAVLPVIVRPPRLISKTVTPEAKAASAAGRMPP
jgi:MFS transporter, OFA family, oxalate/formate antiporter